MRSSLLTFWPADGCWPLAPLAAAVAWLLLGHAAAQQPAAADPSCVNARVGSAEAYNCLNRELQKRALAQHRSETVPAVDARSPAPQVGTYNQAAVREHLGNNFGKSAVPQRPPPSVFVSPLIPTH